MMSRHDFLSKFARRIERLSAYAQGKGYNSKTIRREVDSMFQLSTSPPQLAIDIGGNVGDYAAQLRLKSPRLEIHTFEPSAINVEKLEARFADDPNIKIVPLAVSSVSGTSTLFSNRPGSKLGSLTKRRLDHFNVQFNVQESVRTIRFEDYWMSELDERHVDLVKMDIEGHELVALSGFGKALRETSVLQFEFGGSNIDTRTYFQDFWYFFKSNNFALFRLTPFGVERIGRYRESDEFFSATNYVAINRRSPPRAAVGTVAPQGAG